MFVQRIRQLSSHAVCNYLHNGRVAVLTLNRPNVLNAVSLGMCDEILKCTAEISQSSSDARVLILTGDERAFSAGKDLKASLKHDEAEAEEYYSKTLSMMKALLEVPIPVIVSIEKVCLGLGLELALTGDMRVLGTSAQIGFPEIGLNLFPGCGGAVLLPVILGNVDLASDMILTGRRVSAEEALRIGLVSRVVSDGECFASALKLAEPLMEKNRELLVKTKQTIRFDFMQKIQSSDWMKVSESNRRQVAKLPEHLASLVAFSSKK